jgi:hypothetical protein
VQLHKNDKLFKGVMLLNLIQWYLSSLTAFQILINISYSNGIRRLIWNYETTPPCHSEKIFFIQPCKRYIQAMTNYPIDCGKEGTHDFPLPASSLTLTYINNPKVTEGCLTVHLLHEIIWNANLMQQGNFINVLLARHVSGTYAHHQEH